MNSKKFLILLTLLACCTVLQVSAETFHSPTIVSDHCNFRNPQSITLNTPFYEYPANDSDLTLRKKNFMIIQRAASKLNALMYMKYKRAWFSDIKKADAIENSYQILKYLHETTEKSIAEIQATQIDSGLICWYFYNMGYVFQTSTSKIGIDLHFRGAEKLAPLLDILLTTHGHHDHYNRALMDSMVSLGKPVITNFYPKSIKIGKDTVLYFGDNRIRINIGDHHRQLPLLSSNNMLM